MPRRIPPNQNKLTLINHNPIRAYLEAKFQRDNRKWTISKGEIFTRYNGLKMSQEEFDRLYPVPLPVSFKISPENPDGTKAYLR